MIGLIILALAVSYIAHRSNIEHEKEKLIHSLNEDKLLVSDEDHFKTVVRCNINRACALGEIEEYVKSIYDDNPKIQDKLDRILFYTRIDATNPDWEYKEVGEVWQGEDLTPPSLRG